MNRVYNCFITLIKEHINKIKTALSANKPIAIEVSQNNNPNQHWVVVTGTVSGCEINNIDGIEDLVGVAPYYGTALQVNGSFHISKDRTIKSGDYYKCLGHTKGNGYMIIG